MFYNLIIFYWNNILKITHFDSMSSLSRKYEELDNCKRGIKFISQKENIIDDHKRGIKTISPHKSIGQNLTNKSCQSFLKLEACKWKPKVQHNYKQHRVIYPFKARNKRTRKESNWQIYELKYWHMSLAIT